MRAGLITTLCTNVGDDLIRHGIKRIVEAIYGAGSTEWVEVNKHEPWTAFTSEPARRTIHAVEQAQRGKRRLRKLLVPGIGRLSPSRFDDCDFVIQCGAPVYWENCHLAEWAEPIWYGCITKLAKSMPVCNIAAGSCYAWTGWEELEITPDDRAYIHYIHRICHLTTARDRLAQQICARLGLDSTLLPCAAILSASAAVEDEMSIPGSQRIIINYMPGAGHYAFGQEIDAGEWAQKLAELIDRLIPEFEIVFLCHNRKEKEACRELDRVAEIIVCEDAESYHTTIGRAEVAICNRLHAGIGLASVGIPSIIVGTDTRLLMADELGIPTFYVGSITVDTLESEVRKLLDCRAVESARLRALKRDTEDRYVKLLSSALIR